MSRPIEQQRDAIASRGVGVAAIVTMLVAALGVVVSTVLLRDHGWVGRHGAQERPPLEIGIVAQTPIDDAHGAADLQREQRAELSRYRWLDDRHEIAAIPIDRAMRIVAERKR